MNGTKAKGAEMQIVERISGSIPALAVVAALVLGLGPDARAADRVTFGTDWRAQAEHGGYYQALARGFFAARSLDVTIRQGGPQVNHSQLLAAGRVDFSLSSNSFIVLNFARENIPMVAVAAMFQKDPAVLIAHPGQGNDTLAALKGKPIYIGADTRVGFWRFLKAQFGYDDSQIRPYTFSIAPFLIDKTAIQQGYLGSEPFLMEQQGIKPVVHLLADAGYQSYGALIETSRKLARKKPALVRRFVAAVIAGWRDYLSGDPAPANALIRKANPEMTDALLAYGRRAMIEHNVVTEDRGSWSGIGVMSEARWRSFFETMSAQGLYPKSMDWRAAFTTKFLDSGK